MKFVVLINRLTDTCEWKTYFLLYRKQQTQQLNHEDKAQTMPKKNQSKIVKLFSGLDAVVVRHNLQAQELIAVAMKCERDNKTSRK